MEFVLHSDDLGTTRSISEKMLEGWRDGVFEGFSLLANGDAMDFVAETLCKHADRELQIGVHLNLSEGPSRLPPAEVPLLVDEAGHLKHSMESILVLWLKSPKACRKNLLDQVAREWKAQLNFVKDCIGRRPILSLDGHRHIHMLWFLFPLAARLAKECGVPEVRVSREFVYCADIGRDLCSPWYWVNLVKVVVLRALSIPAYRTIARFGLKANEALVGILYGGKMTSARASQGVRAARKRVPGKIEVIFHVGQATPAETKRWKNSLFSAFHTSERRVIEFSEAAKLRKAFPLRKPIREESASRRA